MKTTMLFLVALLAFAGNSIIARYALLDNSIDPASFIWLRIVSGALALWLLVAIVDRSSSAKALQTRKGNWWGALTLSIYAIAFSFAYVVLETGFGALVLFAAVQLSMFGINLVQGASVRVREWLGSAIAFAGLAYLVAPSLQLPESWLSVVLMIIAGTAWGFYSIHGRGSATPLIDTTYNFNRAIVVVTVALMWFLPDLHVTSKGVGLALLSGAVTSGLGYAVWYLVLPRLHVSTAAIGQLSVPLIATVGGIIVADETITSRLLIAALLIIGGILINVLKFRT
ncbi:EamA-like transporter family protein [Pseudidiomarina maritima]|jgi:drug/metabolite transporter (DMT)-like permease|uniref:EamA-like transporter family protein n=1 Tax=Pseudidiomarina maritima TaxID=519453 RepID=A0A1I6G7V2_9GAMM|nr:DMT family transporter [Pseudidiomarina maritima]SFR38127.1 EamA-like transporter family protein [Pseudidiomarina maritima]